jgi:tRNA-uridine 2-sulfurtransferase
MSKKMKIAVAMSGGVDSSVTAALLRTEGHEVIGITMRLWDGPTTAVDDAARVAGHLGIPHHVASFENCFEERIMRYFAGEYQSGRTPNPCARCNQLIKFGALLDMANQLGADCLATGHYARIHTGADGTPHLIKAVNMAKDQSYFLFSLKLEQLKKIIFPLGVADDKSQVRRIAAEMGIAVAAKDDSQDICFIPDGDYISFLERQGISPRHGDFQLADGTVVGHHKGIHRYTVGQRRGMGIAWSEPLYVVRIEAASGNVIVGPEPQLYRESFTVSDCNWIQPQGQIVDGVKCKIRYRHMPVSCVVTNLSEGRAEVSFLGPVKGVTPGQAAVFYREEELLGGGWIE